MVYTHLVPVTIEQARAGTGHGSDDARLLARLDALLAQLRITRGKARHDVVRSIRACEDELVAHYDRSGRSMLAEAMLRRPLEGESEDEG
jgi:hypothetical protein